MGEVILDKIKDKCNTLPAPKLTAEESKNHIFVLNHRNSLMKIKTHSLSQEKMDRMMLLIYMRTQMHYLFVF